MGYRHFDLCKIEPLFAFGHDLSYTSFEFSDLEVNVNEDTFSLCLNVKNTGKINGATIVEVYLAQREAAIPLPAKSLKGLQKVDCKAGETVKVKVGMNKKISCSYYDTSISKWTMEKATYNVMVGSSSDKIELRSSFDIKKTATWLSPEEI